MSNISAIVAQTMASGRREARREAILDVARACFLSEGYAATSMSAIATRLGGSKGTLYNYFKCKEELFAAVMRRECERQALPLFDRPGEHTLEATLYELARGFLAFILSETTLRLQRVIIGEAGRFPEIGQLFYENGPRLVRHRMTRFLATLMDSGALAEADIETTADHFTALVLSNTDRLRLWGVVSAPTPAELDRQARAAVLAFLRGYGRRGEVMGA